MRHTKIGKDTAALSFDSSVAAPVVKTRTEGTETYYDNFSLPVVGGLGLASLPTASLPASPPTGTQFYDSTLGYAVVYNGSAYVAVGGGASAQTRTIWIGATDFGLPASTGATLGEWDAFKYPALLFDATIDEFGTYLFMLPPDYTNDGNITAKIIWAEKTANSGKTFLVYVGLGGGEDGGTDGMEASQAVLLSSSNSTTQLNHTSVGYTWDLPYDNGHAVLEVERRASSGTDNAVGDLAILGIELTYTGT
jgi:hypothetical protein